MNSVEALKQSLETAARFAPEYKREVSNAEVITLFANKYCDAFDANDESKKDAYFSALMLKFWDQVYKIYLKIKTADKNMDDAASVLTQCIMTACDPVNRIWRKNPKINAQQAINQTIATRGIAQVMYESNLKKNKVNINTVSLDETLDDESGTTRLDMLIDENPTPDEMYDSDAVYTIQRCINDNHLVEAIIMDNMANKDCFKHESHIEREIDEETGEEYKYTKTSSTFWPYKLVKELNDLGPDYEEYFMKTYHVDLEKFKAAFKALTTANNQKKYRMVEACKKYGQTMLA